MNTIKKLDIVIIVFMFILSFTPNIIFSHKNNQEYNSTYALIKVDGEVYDNIPLSSNDEELSLNINTEKGYNVVSIKDSNIRISHANCKDALCVNQGEISSVGETVVCLPHKLIIEIKGKDNDSSSDMILSH